jgi:hypothetical protein
MGGNHSSESHEDPATPAYGYHDPRITLETGEEAAEEFSFSEFFLGKFPIVVLVSALALSLYSARATVIMFFTFLGMWSIVFAALPTIGAGAVGVPAAAIIAAVKHRSFKKIFKPVFTVLLFVVWAVVVVFAFVGRWHLLE